jgi:nucleoside-diphosphate-sugar epimerase
MINLGASGGLLGRIDWPGRTSIIHVDDAAALMIDLSARGDAANQVFCVASDESLTVGDISRIVAGAVGRRVTPIAIPAPLLWLVRRLVWNRALAAAMPAFARVSFWRLSLIVSDGFWFDTAKLRRVYRAPIRPLEQGLADVLDGDSRVKSQSRTEH